jgi:flagellar hook-length control protein FliK
VKLASDLALFFSAAVPAPSGRAATLADAKSADFAVLVAQAHVQGGVAWRHDPAVGLGTQAPPQPERGVPIAPAASDLEVAATETGSDASDDADGDAASLPAPDPGSPAATEVPPTEALQAAGPTPAVAAMAPAEPGEPTLRAEATPPSATAEVAATLPGSLATPAGEVSPLPAPAEPTHPDAIGDAPAPALAATSADDAPQRPIPASPGSPVPSSSLSGQPRAEGDDASASLGPQTPAQGQPSSTPPEAFEGPPTPQVVPAQEASDADRALRPSVASHAVAAFRNHTASASPDRAEPPSGTSPPAPAAAGIPLPTAASSMRVEVNTPWSRDPGGPAYGPRHAPQPAGLTVRAPAVLSADLAAPPPEAALAQGKPAALGSTPPTAKASETLLRLTAEGDGTTGASAPPADGLPVRLTAVPQPAASRRPDAPPGQARGLAEPAAQSGVGPGSVPAVEAAEPAASEAPTGPAPPAPAPVSAPQAAVAAAVPPAPHLRRDPPAPPEADKSHPSGPGRAALGRPGRGAPDATAAPPLSEKAREATADPPVPATHRVDHRDPQPLRHPTPSAAAPPPPPVSHQILQAVRAQPDGPVEIRLSPEELGSVRLTLQPTDGGLTVQITAERPETLDLMRRHLPDLARELRDMGHTSLAFSFAGSNADSQGRAGGNAASPASDVDIVDSAPPAHAFVAAAPGHDGDRLDLRL